MKYIIIEYFTLFLGLGNQWLDKILQLYQITKLNHGLMIVGPSGSGKSTAWQVLLKALEHHEGIEGISFFFMCLIFLCFYRFIASLPSVNFSPISPKLIQT